MCTVYDNIHLILALFCDQVIFFLAVKLLISALLNHANEHVCVPNITSAPSLF